MSYCLLQRALAGITALLSPQPQTLWCPFHLLGHWAAALPEFLLCDAEHFNCSLQWLSRETLRLGGLYRLLLLPAGQHRLWKQYIHQIPFKYKIRLIHGRPHHAQREAAVTQTHQHWTEKTAWAQPAWCQQSSPDPNRVTGSGDCQMVVVKKF